MRDIGDRRSGRGENSRGLHLRIRLHAPGGQETSDFRESRAFLRSGKQRKHVQPCPYEYAYARH